MKERIRTGIKATQMKFLTTDGSHGETVAGDEFTFSDAGEHVVIFTALTGLIASGPQPKGNTEVSRFQTLHDTGVSQAPIWMATLMTGVIFGVFHLLGGVGFDVPGLLFLLFILLLNVFLVLIRLLTRSLWLAIGFHTVFDWMAIIVGLGVVVQYDRHLLHLTRTVSFSAEYLLSMVVVILGILLLLLWARLRNHYLSWHSTLTEDGQLQAPEAQPSTVEQEG